MKVLIVDDEPLARERLAQMLGEVPGASVVGCAGNGREAIDQIREKQPSVVLMDIQMPIMDGMEAAHHLRLLDDPPALVFCTAFDEYALDAFDAAAVDYLVKPIRLERLQEALQKARRYHGDGESAPPRPQSRTHLCARIRGNLELVSLNDVIFLMAEHKYVTVVFEGGEVLIEEPLKLLDKEFGDRFLRIHRNALVALDRIAALEKDPDGRVVIRLDGTDRVLEVSRRNLPAVRKVVKSL
jgi:two-component system response regulator AlgR